MDNLVYTSSNTKEVKMNYFYEAMFCEVAWSISSSVRYSYGDYRIEFFKLDKALNEETGDWEEVSKRLYNKYQCCIIEAIKENIRRHDLSRIIIKQEIIKDFSKGNAEIEKYFREKYEDIINIILDE